MVVVSVGIGCQKCVGRRVSVMFSLFLNEEPKDNLLNPPAVTGWSEASQRGN